MSPAGGMLPLALLAAGCAGGAPAVTAVDVVAPRPPEAAPPASTDTAPKRDQPTEAEMAALPSLTWTKADQALKQHGCKSFDPTWSDRAHGATCTMSDGTKLQFQQATLPGSFANDAILGTMPRGSAVVEQGRLILIVSVERNGLLDERASKRLLRELLVAASGEEPFAVVRAPASTWVAPSLVDVPPDSKRIAPELIVDLVKALHALGYRDAREISYSTNTPQSTQPHSEVSARVGVWGSPGSPDPLYIDVFCGAPETEPKESEAMTGQAIWITGPCWMIANVEVGGAKSRRTGASTRARAERAHARVLVGAARVAEPSASPEETAAPYPSCEDRHPQVLTKGAASPVPVHRMRTHSRTARATNPVPFAPGRAMTGAFADDERGGRRDESRCIHRLGLRP